MRESARRILMYMNLARFVNRHTRGVDIRVILHDAQAMAFFDVRISLKLTRGGELSPTTFVRHIPLTDFLDGTRENVALFTVIIGVSVIAVILCMNSMRDLRNLANLFYDSIVMRMRQRIVRRHFFADVWVLLVEALKIAIPLSLLSGSIVLLVYYFHFSRFFTYESKYRWYDGDGSAAARPLLIKRDAPAPGLVEGLPRGMFRHLLPPDTNDVDS